MKRNATILKGLKFKVNNDNIKANIENKLCNLFKHSDVENITYDVVGNSATTTKVLVKAQLFKKNVAFEKRANAQLQRDLCNGNLY